MVNDLSKYTIADLHALIGDDHWAVRDESMKRHAKAAAKLAKIKAEVEALEKLHIAARDYNPPVFK